MAEGGKRENLVWSIFIFGFAFFIEKFEMPDVSQWFEKTQMVFIVSGEEPMIPSLLVAVNVIFLVILNVSLIDLFCSSFLFPVTNFARFCANSYQIRILKEKSVNFERSSSSFWYYSSRSRERFVNSHSCPILATIRSLCVLHFSSRAFFYRRLLYFLSPATSSLSHLLVNQSTSFHFQMTISTHVPSRWSWASCSSTL